jgi:hypothetical protein
MTAEDTDGRVISDLLARIDNITQHLLDMKGDMYRRSEWTVDSTRIYDQLHAIKVELTAAINDTELLLRTEVASSAIVHAKFATDEQYESLDERLTKLEKNAIPPAVVAFVGALLGALIVGFIQIGLPLIQALKGITP